MEEPKLTLQSFHQCASLVSIKLGANNYLMWRSQILHLSRSLGVLHHLEKNGVKPEKQLENGKTNPDYTSWLTNDGLIISWLLGTIKEEVQPSVTEDSTAYDVWSSLEEQLLPITVEKEGLLKNMLMTIKKGSKSLDSFLKEFKSICDNLAAIKKPVDDLDKVFQLARGLGSKYENFRLAMVTKPPYPTFNQFVLALQGYEQTLNTQKEEEKDHVEYNQAFVSQRGRGRANRGNRGGFSSRGRGFTPAGRYNANSNNFMKEKGANGKQQEKGDKPTCQICGKMNHTALECWYRFDYSYQTENLPQALATLTTNDYDSSQYMDSAATSHMTNNPGTLSHIKPYKGNDVVYVGNGNKLDITHTGDKSIGSMNLKRVLVVPKLKKNLISVSKLTTDNFCTVKFSPSDFVIKDHNKQIIGKGIKRGDLYALDSNSQQALTTITGINDSSLWHQRLGHPSAKVLSLLKGKNFIHFKKWQAKSSICISCQSGKSCKQPFTLNDKISEFPLQKIHCDLWGPAPVISNQAFKFYVIFIDDFSRFTWLYPLRKKSDFYPCFIKFQKLVENQFDKKIKVFQCDGGGEFNSSGFHDHLSQSGIQLQMSCPGTPEQNGVAERKHRHIVETGLTMLFHANIPLFLWTEIFLAAVYLINRMPTSVLLNDSPYSKLYGKEPNYRSLRVIGCLCYPSLRYQGGNKFVKKTYPCVFIGYSTIHKGYRCYEPKSKRVYISRHVVFDEGKFLYKPGSEETNHHIMELVEFPSLDEWFKNSVTKSDLKVENQQSTSETENQEEVAPISNYDMDNQTEAREENKFDISNKSLQKEEPSIVEQSEVQEEPSMQPEVQEEPFIIEQPEVQEALQNTPTEEEITSRPQRNKHPPRYLENYECYLSHSNLPIEPSNHRQALKDPRWINAMEEELKALHLNQTWSLVP